MRALTRYLPLVCCLGCSWSRFDEVVEDSPVVLLKKPKSISSGFGSSLTSANVNGKVTLLAGGAPLGSSAAAFDLGDAEAPTLGALDSSHCGARAADDPCFLSDSPAALAVAKAPGGDLTGCFASGAGTALDGRGVVVRCADDSEYHLDTPAAAAKSLDTAIETRQPEAYHFAADSAESPGLLAATTYRKSGGLHGVVWYYPPRQRTFVELAVPNPDLAPESFGQKLAVARVGQAGRLLAVAAPSEGQVRLYYAEDGATPSYIGCLGEGAAFGRALAAGPVGAGDSDDELLISDATRVFVFDGAKLATLPPTESSTCSLSSLPEGALISTLGCDTTEDISGCASSEFGDSLGVGDLDGDGDGEVVVGAPGMTVRHVDRGGALLIFDVEQPGDADSMDVAFVASAEQDDQLGRAIALPKLANRSIIAGGAPGGGKVALFYCPSFLPPELAGPRCR